MTPTEATALLRNIASYIEGGASVRLRDAQMLRQVAEWISKQSPSDDAKREQELIDLMRPMRVSGASWHV